MSAPLGLLCDEQISVPVYRALAAEGFDITHILALGLGSLGDPQVLQRAKIESRVLATRNYRDFAPLVEKWAKEKVLFPGVLFVAKSIPQADVGAHVRAVKKWSAGVESGINKIENSYGWLAL